MIATYRCKHLKPDGALVDGCGYEGGWMATSDPPECPECHSPNMVAKPAQLMRGDVVSMADAAALRSTIARLESRVLELERRTARDTEPAPPLDSTTGPDMNEGGEE